MNVFATDHPLVSEPSPRMRGVQRRLLRGFLAALIGYPFYLLLLGPYSALDGRGDLQLVPSRVREICYWPSAPIWMIPHVRGRLAGYLDWWYLHANSADRETGWD